tara:strand:+ start:383 stop:745 length:363 start_codon:yes stop_codon:yes gene_type:complete
MALKANDFLSTSSAIRHEVETPSGTLVVFVKPMTWIQQQEAVSRFVDFRFADDGEVAPKIDFGGYYSYVLTNCIERTEPSISKKDILNIRPEVGKAIMGVLPSINDLTNALTGGEEAPLG